MSGIAVAVAGGTIVGGLLTSSATKSAASTASEAQMQSTELAIEEQRRQFDKIQEVLAPFVTGGAEAFAGQGALVGLGGPEAEAAAIAGIEASPEFAALTQQGEEAILQNAAATGGLRGGNVQGALAQFRPQVLSGLINQRYGRLSGLSSLGQASAAGQAAAGQQTGGNISGLLTQQGDAQAQSALLRGSANANLIGDVTSALSTLATSGAF